MKRILKSAVLLLVTMVFGASLIGCVKIDGAQFIVTLAEFTREYTEGKDTTEDTSDDVFNLKLEVTITVNISEKNLEVIVKEESFAFTPEPDSYLMKSIYGKTSSITAKGNEEGNTTVTFVYLEVDYGGGHTEEEVEQIRKDLKVTYKGNKLKVPAAKPLSTK